MTRTYMISGDKLKEISFIHKNIDEKDLNEIIWRCQETQIQPVLGTGLYKKVLADITAFLDDSTPIPANYKTLLEDFIWPFLAACCEGRGTTHLNWKIREQAVGTNNDQYVKPGSKQETTDLKDEFNKDMIHYRNIMI